LGFALPLARRLILGRALPGLLATDAFLRVLAFALGFIAVLVLAFTFAFALVLAGALPAVFAAGLAWLAVLVLVLVLALAWVSPWQPAVGEGSPACFHEPVAKQSVARASVRAGVSDWRSAY